MFSYALIIRKIKSSYKYMKVHVNFSKRKVISHVYKPRIILGYDAKFFENLEALI